VRAIVEADSEAAAAKLIIGQGLVPTDIRLEGGAGNPFARLSSHVKAKDRVLFSRQLSTLINAGLPLLQALRSVNQQTVSKPLKQVLTQIIGAVEGGSSLSAAMAKHPRVFSRVYIALIAAGETSGTLDAALERLAVQQEKEADLNAKIRGALTYPVIVLVVMTGVIGFMVVKVLPQVKVIYDSIENDSNFLPLVPNMLRIGEQSGAIEEMMAKVADYYEKEVDNEVAAISSIIEPVMMVLLGIVAFTIVAAVLLPIYSLAGNSSFTNPSG
jgi:type IV pilus assembly protein PilC